MNMLPFLRASLLAAVSLSLAAPLVAQGVSPANRIASGADLTGTTRLTGHLPKWVNAASDVGAVADETPVRLSFLLTRSTERELAFTQLLVDQQNPASARYHQWLTPAQIGEQYGPSLDDVTAVENWIAVSGLKVESVSAARIYIVATGTTGAAAAALSTSFHNFMLDGEARLSATSEPAIPAALAAVVGGIDGLTEIPLRPFSAVKAAERGDPLRPMYSATGNTSHYVFPGDFAKIYDMTGITTAGYTGSGVKVAIIGRSQITSSDITQLESMAGIPSKVQNVVLIPTSADPGLVKGDEDESTLDVGRVLTTSTGAQADLVIAANANGGISAAMQYNVNTLLDPVMSISYGACESAAGQVNVNFFDGLFKNAAAEGISTFVSSGDSAAAGCSSAFAAPKGTEVLGINYLCASSYVTCVGGTEFNDAGSPSSYWSATNSSTYVSALGYIPEGAWNEPTYQSTSGGVTTTGYQIAGTGGGTSIYIAKPTWQAGTGVPADGMRDTPDVSFTSSGHDGYFACLAYLGSSYNCAAGGGTIFYGTSAAAPGMAAVAAILNQRAGKPQGNLNPVLYALAASTPAAFHDATPASSGVSGCTVTTPSMCNNSTPGVSSLTGGLSGYPLTVGYDEATGLGSLDVTNFITAAAGSVVLGSTTTLTASPTTIAIGGTTIFTATVVGSGSAAATGTAQFYLNGTALGSAVTIVGGKASTGATPFATAGTYSITAIYSGDTNYAASTSAVLSFVVTLPSTTTTVTAVPTTVVAGKSAVFTATIAVTSGTAATGTVQFYSNGNALGSPVAVSGGTAASASTTFTTAGNYAITANYSGDSKNAASTSAALNFVVTALPASTTTVTANPATILAGRTAAFSAVVAVTSGTPATGTVQFYSNGSGLGTAVALVNGSATTAAIPFATAGTYPITATYSGDSSNSPSTSAALSFVVSPLPAVTTTVTAVPATVVAGGTTVFTASLSTVTATGTVQFYSNGTALGSAIAVAGGKASTPSTQFAAAGTYAITAVYSGDTNNAASTSASLSFVVTAATVTGLTATPSPNTLTVTAGATTGNSSTITLATTAGYYGMVTMGCSVSNSTGTIYPPTCAFAPASVTFTGTTSGISVVTLGTTLPHAVPGGTQSRNNGMFVPAGGLSLAGLLLLLIPKRRHGRMGRLLVLPLVLLGAGLMALSGCGSSGASATGTPTAVGTTKGSYVVTVTATPSAGTAVTANITLTVQ